MRQWIFACVALSFGAAIILPADTVAASGLMGVYNKSASGHAPDFAVDPGWPAPLPHNWMLGAVGGLYVDRHNHVWVFNRPRSLSNAEDGLEKVLPGAVNAKGEPITGLGFVRPFGPLSNCCRVAPSVLEFDTAGKLLRAWGGPTDPGFMENKCKAEAGCIWPNSEHGIYVDSHDNVWLSGNQGNGENEGAGMAPNSTFDRATGKVVTILPEAKTTPWTTNRTGDDGFILKFDADGNFKMRIGGTPKGQNSNDKDSGSNGTPLLDQPTDMVVDPKTNRLYIADGYGNRRILIVDADSGKYLGHFGAYGNSPVDDATANAAGAWLQDAAKGNTRPTFFRSPVHCVKIADDGKIYVCDRGNDRIQVFDKNSPELGKPCSNPKGEAGKCGFLAEQWISRHTETHPSMPGTAVSINFSTDKAQSCLYVGDNTNMTIYILNRDKLQELGRLGNHGRMAGDFHWLHQVSVDSGGNIYTGEVDNGKRIQKFVRRGALGCSGTGFESVGDLVDQ